MLAVLGVLGVFALIIWVFNEMDKQIVANNSHNDMTPIAIIFVIIVVVVFGSIG